MLDNIVEYVKGKFYPPATQSDLDPDDYSWFIPEVKLYSSDYTYNGKGRINVGSHPVFGMADIRKSIELYRNYWFNLLHEKIVVIVCNCIGKCNCKKRENFITLMKDFGCVYCGEILNERTN